MQTACSSFVVFVRLWGCGWFGGGGSESGGGWGVGSGAWL